MNKLEQRLNAAAEETRKLARRRPVTKFDERAQTRHRGALILAAAFAVVILMFGLLPLLMSEPTGSTGSEVGTPSTPMTTPTTVATTLGTAPEIECSAQGVPLPEEAEALPAAVATTREAIITAAAACGLTALESLAGDMLTTSLGGGGVENLRSWENQGEHPLATLLHLFDMTYATVELEDGGTIYVWPAAATYESWSEVTEEEIDELSRIHSEGELDQIAGYGSYIGWRTGIDQDGNWLYLTAFD
ncbi:MAG TPA: hypothetical protein VF148_05140 [Acidimicrobiia bacterium]